MNSLLSLSKEKIKIKVEKGRYRPVDIPVMKGDNSLIREQFNLFPEFELEETLKKNIRLLETKLMKSTEHDLVASYNEESIKTLDWKEHIRKRPGMYIGKLGNGSSQDDGIYILIKEVADNAIDEYMMGFGKKIDITISDHIVKVRDYGRGVPLGKLIDVSAKMNTGAKYDSKVFKKSVGLNGVGIKAVNALSENFLISSIRDGKKKSVEFSKGMIKKEYGIKNSDQVNGTEVSFYPDKELFGDFHFMSEYVENLLWNYVYLNSGLVIYLNKKRFFSKNGLLDLLNANINIEPRYSIIHLKGEDIEIALTHGNQYGEEYYSFVNGQHTTQGGTHLIAFREGIIKTIRDFYKKDFDVSDIRSSIIAAISVKIEEPIFESQTKTKLGSKEIAPDGISVRNFIVDFMSKELDDYLHKNPDAAEQLLLKIQESERERKAMSGIKKTCTRKSKKSKFT